MNQTYSGDESDTCKRKMRSQLLTCSTTGEKPTGQMCTSTYRVSTDEAPAARKDACGATDEEFWHFGMKDPKAAHPHL